MAMNFFEHQEAARKKTGRLVVLFVAAVLGIMTLVYLAVAMVVVVLQSRRPNSAGFDFAQLWQPDVLILVGLGVLAVVGFRSAISWRGLIHVRPPSTDSAMKNLL